MELKIDAADGSRGMDSIQKHIDVKMTEKENVSAMISEAQTKLDILKGIKNFCSKLFKDVKITQVRRGGVSEASSHHKEMVE